MIVTVTPADLRPGDRVLLNGGWWSVVDSDYLRFGHRRIWRLVVEHDEDIIEIFRADTEPLTVDRAEP